MAVHRPPSAPICWPNGFPGTAARLPARAKPVSLRARRTAGGGAEHRDVLRREAEIDPRILSSVRTNSPAPISRSATADLHATNVFSGARRKPPGPNRFVLGVRPPGRVSREVPAQPERPLPRVRIVNSRLGISASTTRAQPVVGQERTSPRVTMF